MHLRGSWAEAGALKAGTCPGPRIGVAQLTGGQACLQKDGTGTQRLGPSAELEKKALLCVFHARFLYSTKVFPPCFCAYPGRSLPLHHRGVSSGPHHGTSYRFANGRGCHKPARALALGLAPGGATCTLVYDTHANSEAASGGRRSAARSSFLRAPSGSTPMSSRSWFVSKHSAARSTSARTKSLRAHPRERCG